jgi:di/tricarboxylate transporter
MFACTYVMITAPFTKDVTALTGRRFSRVCIYFCYQCVDFRKDVAVQIGGRFANISNVTTAMMGISALMMLGIITWKDVLAYGPAWDTLFWFAILIGMATNLDKLGVIKFFADQLADKIDSIGLGMLPVSLWPLFKCHGC